MPVVFSAARSKDVPNSISRFASVLPRPTFFRHPHAGDMYAEQRRLSRVTVRRSDRLGEVCQAGFCVWIPFGGLEPPARASLLRRSSR